MTPEFVAEAQEIVDALGGGLLAAEEEAKHGKSNPERINNLFREAHSLKGIAGMFGLEQITQLAHALESVLDGMRLGRIQINAANLDVLFATVEKFSTLIAQVSTGAKTEAGDVQALIEELEQAARLADEHHENDLKQAGLQDEILAVLTEYEEHRLRDNIRQGNGLYLLHTTFDLTSFDVGLADLDAVVKDLGEVITKLPSSETTSIGQIAFDILVGSSYSEERLSVAISDERIQITTIRDRQGSVAANELDSGNKVVQEQDVVLERQGPENEATLPMRSVAQTVRVDIKRLDQLMNLVGELSLICMTFQKISETVRRQVGFGEVTAELHKVNRNFERRLGELQSGLVDVRMVPMAYLFERVVRVARKAARELGREVHIRTSGENTELDKLIIEDLADPLMHIIRNCVDHGIEPPEERKGLGKPREGMVHMCAAAPGNHVVLTISDDGRGINIEQILETAVARGLIEGDRAAEMSDKEALNLIFLPGLSTRSSVTEYSGRGVGMDVVKTNISKLSGVLSVDSSLGQGTTISITLPITLAIIPALIVSISETTYAIPLNNVLETLGLDSSWVQTIDRREMITVRGGTVPVLDLRRTFQLKEKARPEKFFGVVAGAAESRIVILVDDVLGQQDIVIKSLGHRLVNVAGIAGATELGNQETVLVIDTVELLNEMAAGGLEHEELSA